jgi:hypothetical protein
VFCCFERAFSWWNNFQQMMSRATSWKQCDINYRDSAIVGIDDGFESKGGSNLKHIDTSLRSITASTEGSAKGHAVIVTGLQGAMLLSPSITAQTLLPTPSELSRRASIACEEQQLSRLGAFVEQTKDKVHIKVRMSACSTEKALIMFQQHEGEYTEVVWAQNGSGAFTSCRSGVTLADPIIWQHFVDGNCVRKEPVTTVPSGREIAQYDFRRYRSETLPFAYLDEMMNGSYRAVTISVEILPTACDHDGIITECFCKLSALDLDPIRVAYPTKLMHWLSVFRGEDYNNVYSKVNIGADAVDNAVLDVHADETMRRSEWARKYLFDMFCAANFAAAYIENAVDAKTDCCSPKFIQSCVKSLEEARVNFLDSGELVYIPGGDCWEDEYF